MYGFEFSNDRLSIDTQQLRVTIEGGAITYVQDKASGEVLVNTDAYTNRPSGTTSFVGFMSEAPGGNVTLRWPTRSSSVAYSRTAANKARLVYSPLYTGGTPSSSRLIVDVSVDPPSGEVTLQLTGEEADPGLKASAIDLPAMNITATAVILGSGARYVRTEAEAVDQSSYVELGLHSPTMAVVEGRNATLAVWSETTQFAREYIQLRHKPGYDHVVLHAEQDLKQTDRQQIISPPWHIGTYPNWAKAARRWREKFEERTGATPLWWNPTAWVRNVHAVFDAASQSYGDDESKYAELAGKAAPAKVLYFLWNGDRIVLYGDHTLVREITRPSAAEVDLVKQHGWPLLLFHPYDLIYSRTGAMNRLSYLEGRGWLPDGYQFTPDYPGTPQNWQDYWSDVRANYFDGSQFYVLHPGSSKFKDYFIDNLAAYCSRYRADGAYLDLLGDDNNFFFPDGSKIVEGQDYVLGESNAIARLRQELPDLAVMSEYQSAWMLPFAFYSWEGSVTHIRQNTRAGTRINHPLRVALIGSYAWTRESNSETIDDIVAALLGTLPQISLVGDYGVSPDRAVWSQARSRLFVDEELYNDLPDEWDEDALAYYRSKSGNWFKFKRLGSTYGYVEILPGGQEIVRLAK